VPRDVVDELFKRGVAAALCDAATQLKQPRATPGGARNRSGAADSAVWRFSPLRRHRARPR